MSKPDEPSAIPPLKEDRQGVEMQELKQEPSTEDVDIEAGPTTPSKAKTKNKMDKEKSTNALFQATKDLGASIVNAGEDIYSFLDEKLFLREFCVYAIFLILFTVTTLTSRAGSEAFFFTDTMRDYFIDEEFLPEDSHILKKFEDVGTESEMWQFLQGPFIGNLLPTEDVNGISISPERSRYIGGQTRIIGAIRVRTIRMKPNACEVADRFKDIFDDCYGSRWSKTYQDIKPYGPGGVWTYQDSDALGEVSTWGTLDNYPGNGHSVVLEATAANATAGLQFMKENRFVDDATRVVFVDFTVYNANVNLFCVIKLWFEFPGTGGAIPNHSFRTIRIYRYLFLKDYFVLAGELILVIFVLVYIGEEIWEIKNQKWSYFKDAWNYYDWLNLLLFFTAIMFRIAAVVKTASLDLKSDTSDFVEFQPIAWLMQQEINVNSFNGFLCWFKVFKYLKISKRLGQLTRTLNHATWDLLTFLVMFVIVLFGYTHMGFLAFGPDIRGFRNLTNSLVTLFQAMIGSVDFEALDRANRFLGPLFYMTYLVLVFLIMMNMFLAIVNASYTTIVLEDFEDDHAEESKLDFTAFFGDIVTKVKKKFNKETTEGLVKNIEAGDENKDNMMDKNEVSKVLETDEGRQVFEGESADAVIARYDRDGDGKLNLHEQDELKKDIRGAAADDDDETAEARMLATSAAATGGRGSKSPSGQRPGSRLHRRRMSRAASHTINDDSLSILILKLDQMDKAISQMGVNLRSVTERLDRNAGGRGGAAYPSSSAQGSSRPALQPKARPPSQQASGIPRKEEDSGAGAGAGGTGGGDASSGGSLKGSKGKGASWDSKVAPSETPKSLGTIAGIPPP